MNILPDKLPQLSSPVKIETGSSGKGNGEYCGLGIVFT